MNIIKFESYNWQYPVITEKYAFEKLKENKYLNSLEITYLAIPWATLLDNYNDKFIHKVSFKQYLDSFLHKSWDSQKITFTICQSIHFRTLLPYLSSVGVKVLFASHAIKSEYEEIFNKYKIIVLPFPLYAVNTARPSTSKKYLYSFIGCISYPPFSKEAFRATSVRTNLFNLDHNKNNSIVKKINEWHFKEVVYEKQVKGREIKQKAQKLFEDRNEAYKEILASSTFTLCPRGTGPNTIRFWESLGSGSIPVVIADDFWLPNIRGIKWEKCMVKISEKNISSLPKILSQASQQEIEEMTKSGISAYNKTSGSNFISCVEHYFKNII